MTALNTQGCGHVTLSASNVPFGASFIDHGNNTATFSWTALSSQSGIYLIGIHGTAGALIETACVRITVRLAPPVNDEIDKAVPITSVPFTVYPNNRGGWQHAFRCATAAITSR